MEPSSPTTVADIMSSPVETIRADRSVTEAATRMRDSDIGALLIPTGPPSIITKTDILGAVADGRDTSALTVADVMTESVETIPPELRLNETAAMMTNFGISHLPVVDDDYVGMISSTDITTHLS
jgi:CBS domain-containing protein